MNSILQLLSKHRSGIMGFAILWIMLFHFGLYFSMSRKNFSLKKYYKSRFFRIIPEFWLIICIVFLTQMNFSLKSFIFLFCRATTLSYWMKLQEELWFIPCIIFLYIIFPVYFKLFKKYGTKVSLYFVCAGLSLILIYALTCIYYYDNKNFGGFIIFTYARIPIFFYSYRGLACIFPCPEKIFH